MPFLGGDSKTIFYSDSYSTSSDETKPPVTALLIHGLGSSNSYYAPIIPILKSIGVRCVAIDTRGSGLSKLTTKEQSIESIVSDIVLVLETLDIKTQDVVIVGHSMGGTVASEFASSYPVRGVVLLGPVHPQPALFEIFSKRAAVVKQDGMEAMAATIPNSATGSRASDLTRAFIRTLLLAQDVDGYISLCNVIANSKPPKYGQIEYPLLIIAGEEDKSAPLPGCQTIHDSYGTISSEKELKVIEGMGHWHCLEQPVEVGSLVRDFVQKRMHG